MLAAGWNSTWKSPNAILNQSQRPDINILPIAVAKSSSGAPMEQTSNCLERHSASTHSSVTIAASPRRTAMRRPNSTRIVGAIRMSQRAYAAPLPIAIQSCHAGRRLFFEMSQDIARATKLRIEGPSLREPQSLGTRAKARRAAVLETCTQESKKGNSASLGEARKLPKYRV